MKSNHVGCWESFRFTGAVPWSYDVWVPRANRYIVAGNIYHLTHRCHDRRFLLKFARDRDGYRRRLREAIVQQQVSLLTYNITSNHVHLLVYADESDQIARFMQRAAGRFAQDYNERKGRTGAFWEGRYHASMVDSGAYLWACLTYVELNMVRTGVVGHPREWNWSGYGELMGLRQRNRLLDTGKLLFLLGGASLEDLRKNLEVTIEQRLARDECAREPRWTESIAVGSADFVGRIESRIASRQRMDRSEEGGAWVLRDNHESFSAAENRALGPWEASN